MSTTTKWLVRSAIAVASVFIVVFGLSMPKANAASYSWMFSYYGQGALAQWCAEPQNGNTADHSPIDIYTCRSPVIDQQLWTAIVSVYDPAYEQLQLHAVGKCLTDPGDRTDYQNNVRLELDPCDGTASQAWHLVTVPDSEAGIVWQNPNGMVINLYQGALQNGQPLIIWHLTGWPSPPWPDRWQGPTYSHY